MAEKPKVLVQLRDVKMHFPIKKDKLLQKEKLYVKAMDGVSLDIYEGETFGLVGESGCGKTTLGRVALQLYKQTSGSVRYRGITLNDYAPAYAFKDIAGIPLVKGLPGEILENHLRQVRIAGGLLLLDDLPGLAQAVRENLLAVKEVNRIENMLDLCRIKRDALQSSENLTGSEQSRLSKAEKKIEQLREKLRAAEEKRDTCDAAIAAMHDKCRDKPGYELLQEAKDVSIDLSRLKKEEMRRQRRHLQIIFQDPYSSLNTRFTVGNIISESLTAHNMYKRGTRQLEEYTLEIMEKCGLANYFIHRYPHQFSGGQRQRIGIARALACNPKFVVCDEAVSALDVSIQSQIINLLIDLKESSNLTYLFISHNLSTVKFISDRVGVMYLGEIIELGNSDSIFAEAMHPYTCALLEAIPTTDEESGKEMLAIEGDVPSPINPPPGCKFHTRCKYARKNCSADKPPWRELRPEHFVACHYPVGMTQGDDVDTTVREQ